MILASKEKVLSVVKWYFNRESKTYLCTSDKAGFFSNKRSYDSYKCWTCTEFSDAFTIIMEIYMCNLVAWYANK